MLAVDCRGTIAEVFTNQAYVPPSHFPGGGWGRAEPEER
jgi:hypothetical protein